jgi:hypothetical protein
MLHAPGPTLFKAGSDPVPDFVQRAN